MQRFTLATSSFRVPYRNNRFLQAFSLVFLGAWAFSIIGTTDLYNWFIENAMTVASLTFILVSYRYYKFSDLTYLFITVYISLHVYGSKYTYAENPFGYWMKDFFGFERNHYDRLVHFCQGFLLAYPMREMFIHWLKWPRGAGWVIPLMISLTTSACYELLEWGVADVMFPEQGPAYLGTQGDVWDAQKDTFLAFAGAVIASSAVSALNRALRKRIV